MESNQDSDQVADSDRGELIERMVLDIINKNRISKLGEVVAGLQKLDKFLSTEEIHDAARRLERKGEVSLSKERVGHSFVRNLADLSSNAPFWISIIACAATILLTVALPQEEPATGVKRIFAAAFLFLIPGYATTNALIARNRLSFVERIAISLGLSLGAIVLIGMVLSYGIAGIRLEPVVISVASYVVAMAFAGAYRDFRGRQSARLSHQRFLREHSASR
jgi:hypothetical protein